MSKALVIYYSHSGNTRRLAEMIAQQIQGDCVELIPEKAYPQAYNAVVDQAEKEIKAGYRPPLKNVDVDLTGYDTIIVGTPNWWSTIAPPVATFLETSDLSDKKVAVFCTHGGGGSGHIERDVKKLCPAADMQSCLSVYGDSCKEAQVEKWISKIR